MLTHIAKVQSRIFGTFFNPTGARTGRKLLMRKPYGERMGSYYPKQLEDYRHEDVGIKQHLNTIWQEKNELRRQAGKAAPKKGQGKRSKKK